MLKKCMIALAVVVLMVSVVSAADPAIQAIDLCKFPVYMDVGHFVQLPEYNNCMYPVYTDAGYYVEIKDCTLRKLNLVQVDCESIGKGAGDFPCFTGCEEIELRGNFPAILGTELARIGPILDHTCVYWDDDDNQIDGTGDWEKLTVCMDAWKGAVPDVQMLVGEITISTTIPVTLSGWVWLPDAPNIGYSLNEGDWVYFYSSEPAMFYNINIGQWVEPDFPGWIYFNWPFFYVLDIDTLIFVLPPESGLWVYHFSTGEWEWLPRIIPW